MKIIEHVMLFSYIGEKKKKWKGKEFFERYVKIFYLRFLTISRIRVYLLFRLLLCKVEKSVCCEKKIGGEGVAQ